MTELPKKPQVKGVTDEPPPFLGTWPRVYAAVLFCLFAMIVLFWTFGRLYTP